MNLKCQNICRDFYVLSNFPAPRQTLPNLAGWDFARQAPWIQFDNIQTARVFPLPQVYSCSCLLLGVWDRERGRSNWWRRCLYRQHVWLFVMKRHKKKKGCRKQQQRRQNPSAGSKKISFTFVPWCQMATSTTIWEPHDSKKQLFWVNIWPWK